MSRKIPCTDYKNTVHQSLRNFIIRIFLIENNSYEIFYYKNGTVCYLMIYDILTVYCEVILLLGYSEVQISILAIVLALTVDFGWFWDCAVILKLKVPVCISYYIYQYNFLSKINAFFEIIVWRIYPDFSYLYAQVTLGRWSEIMGYLTNIE